MASEVKNYEFAYILSPSIAEDEVLTYTNKINALIEEVKGAVKRTEEPKKRMLAYSVKKQKNGYFGLTVFSTDSSSLAELKKKLKGESYILRHLLTVEEVEKYPAMVRSFPVGRRQAPAKPRPLLKKSIEVKPEEKLDLEALDKKLEEILGK